MFTSSQDIQVYRNQLRQKYNEVRQKYATRVQPLTQNSSMYGLNLPFLNLSQIGKSLQSSGIQNISIINNIFKSDENNQSICIQAGNNSFFKDIQQKDYNNHSYHNDEINQNYKENLHQSYQQYEKQQFQELQIVDQNQYHYYQNNQNKINQIQTSPQRKHTSKKKVTIKQFDFLNDSVNNQQQGALRQSLNCSNNSNYNNPFKISSNKSILKGSWKMLKQLKNIGKEDNDQQSNSNSNQSYNNNNNYNYNQKIGYDNYCQKSYLEKQKTIQNEKENNQDQIQKQDLKDYVNQYECKFEKQEDYDLSYSNNGTQIGCSNFFNKARSPIFDKEANQQQEQLSIKNVQIIQANSNQILQQNNSFNFNMTIASVSYPIESAQTQMISSNSVVENNSSNEAMGVSAFKFLQKSVHNQKKQKNSAIFEDYQNRQNSMRFCQSESHSQSLDSDPRIKDEVMKLPFLQTILEKNSQFYQENITTQRDYSQGKKYEDENKSTGFSYRQKSFQDNYYQIMDAIRRISTLCMRKQQLQNKHISTLQDLQYDINKSISQLKRIQLKFAPCLTFNSFE